MIKSVVPFDIYKNIIDYVNPYNRIKYLTSVRKEWFEYINKMYVCKSFEDFILTDNVIYYAKYEKYLNSISNEYMIYEEKKNIISTVVHNICKILSRNKILNLTVGDYSLTIDVCLVWTINNNYLNIMKNIIQSIEHSVYTTKQINNRLVTFMYLYNNKIITHENIDQFKYFNICTNELIEKIFKRSTNGRDIDFNIVKYLLKNDADPKSIINNENFYKLSQDYFDNHSGSNVIDLIKLFIECGIDINHSDSCMLVCMIKSKNKYMIKYLLKRGAIIDIQNQKMISLIIMTENIKIINLFLPGDKTKIITKDILMDQFDTGTPIIFIKYLMNICVGFNINDSDINIIYLIRNSEFVIIKFLILNGYDIKNYLYFLVEKIISEQNIGMFKFLIKNKFLNDDPYLAEHIQNLKPKKYSPTYDKYLIRIVKLLKSQ